MSTYLTAGGYFKYDETSTIEFMRRYQLRKMMRDIADECDVIHAKCYQMSRQLDAINMPIPSRKMVIDLNRKSLQLICNIDNMYEEVRQGKHKNDMERFAIEFLATANNLVDTASDIRRAFVEFHIISYTQ